MGIFFLLLYEATIVTVFTLLLFIMMIVSIFPYLISSEKDMVYNRLYTFAKQQAVVGTFWNELKKSIYTTKLSDDEVLDWEGKYLQIARRNEELYKKSVWVCRKFEREGFAACVLKGQGNAVLYPDPWSRTSGDIDIWVWPKDTDSHGGAQDIAGRRMAVMRYVRRFIPDASFRYHHVDFPVIKGIPVEVHFFPLYMNNPWANRRLQVWFEKERPKQFVHRITVPERKADAIASRHSEPQSDVPQSFCTPTAGFNLVYQMCHILHHFFDDGIGLRQLIDYYYVLQQEYSIEEKNEACRLLKQLHVWKFVRAVMYIQQEVLGLDERYLLAEPDAQRGKILLNEMIKSGNFGRTSGLARRSIARKYFAKIGRNLRLVHMCPSEALWEPWFRTWHFFWRQYAKVKYS